LSLAARFVDERGQEHRTAGCVAAWMENLKRIVGEVRPGIDIMPTQEQLTGGIWFISPCKAEETKTR
jgi:hypothetical protein